MKEKLNSKEEVKIKVKDLSNSELIAPIKARMKKPDVLEVFEKRQQQNEIFNYEFTFSDGRGGLYAYEDDVKVYMSNRQLDGFSKKFFREDKEAALKREYSVVVTNIDKEDRVVHVSANKACEAPRNELIALIDEGIRTKEYVKVPARVVKVTGYDEKRGVCTILIVDIGDLGIAGAIRVDDWSCTFTNGFDYIVKPGEIIDVVITNTLSWKSGEVYECSRKLTLTEDPWKDIEKRVPVKTAVRVTCICRSERNFWGVLKGVPELNVYCEYPDPENGFIPIVEGEDYTGYVAKVNEETTLLRVRITGKV